jgi:2-hydroxychromene-2-carboxylate isomerase
MRAHHRQETFRIFGSPTFTVGRELFWGDDRLEDAISWCRSDRIERG